MKIINKEIVEIMKQIEAVANEPDLILLHPSSYVDFDSEEEINFFMAKYKNENNSK